MCISKMIIGSHGGEKERNDQNDGHEIKKKVESHVAQHINYRQIMQRRILMIIRQGLLE